MRLLAFHLLLLPTVACALGVEDTEFYGLLEGDKVLRLSFVEDPQPWSRQRPVYGTTTAKSFAFCWTEKINEVRQSFVCAPSRGSKPSLVYGVLSSPEQPPKYDAKTPGGAEYRKLSKKARLGNGTQRGDGTLSAIFECKSGCTPELPRYIFEVAKYD